MSIEAFRPESYVDELLTEMAECSRGMAEAADAIQAAQVRHRESLERRIKLSDTLWQEILAECQGNVDWARFRMHELQTRYFEGSQVAGENHHLTHLHAVEN